MNAYSPTLFAVGAPCLPCCSAPPAACFCALLIPPLDVPYADYATAAAAIADSVFGCLVYFSVVSPTSASASFDGTTLSFAATDPGGGPGSGVTGYASVSLVSGQTMSAVYSVSTGGTISGDIHLSLFRCGETSPVGTDASPSASGTLVVTAPSDGEYFFLLGGSAIGFFSFSLTASITSSGAIGVNPVIALWDDSGTTRNLWACPKMLLPPLTESTGTWYVSCAAAHADIATFAVSCIGYISCSPTTTSRTATGGSSLVLSGHATDSGPSFAPSVSGSGGFNALGGDTISLAYAISSDDSIGTDYAVAVYDDTGIGVYSNVVSGGPNISGTLTFTAPYSGRYSTSFGASGGGNATSLTGSLTVTSSGTMSANLIQARYDAGLTCAGTLDCGDACP